MRIPENLYRLVSIGLTAMTMASGYACAAKSASQTALKQPYRQSYLYALSAAGNITQFRIRSNGTLIQLIAPNISFGGSSSPTITFTPSGHYAYIAGDNGTVSQFAVGTDGRLTRLNPPTVAVGKSPQEVTIDPTGHFAYVPNLGDGTVSEFRILDDGRLVPAARRAFRRGGRPQAIQFSPNGRAVYLIDRSGLLIKQKVARPKSAAARDNAVLTGGEVIYYEGTTSESSSGPLDLTFGTSGKAAYLRVWGGPHSGLYQYSVRRDGALRPLNPVRILVGAAPSKPTLDPRSHYVYVGCPGQIYEYRAAASGALTPLLNKPIQNAGDTIGGLVIDPAGCWVYANGFESGTVHQYRIRRDGVLLPLSPSYISAGVWPQVPILDPSGRFLYAPNMGIPGPQGGSGTVSQYRIGADGRLISLPTKRVAVRNNNPVVLVIHEQ